MDPAGPDRPATLPSGPHPTIGRGSVSMPRWPGPLLIGLGALLGIVGLSAGVAALDGQGGGDGAPLFGWLVLVGAALFTAGLLYVAVRQLRVRRFLPPERYRGPSVVVLLLIALVLASVLTAPFGADASALLLGEGELTFLGATALLTATQVALLIVSWFFVFRPGALEALPSLPGRDPWGAIRAGIGWGVLAWLGATLVSAGVVWLLETLGFEAEPQAAERAIELLDPWLVVLAIVILAPIARRSSSAGWSSTPGCARAGAAGRTSARRRSSR